MQDFLRLLKYLKPHKLTFIAAILAMVGVALFEAATGALLLPIVEQFIPSSGDRDWIPFNIHDLIPKEPWDRAWLYISGFLIFFTICKGISEYFSTYLMSKIGQSVILDIRRQLYDHLLSQPASFFEQHRTNFLVSRLVVSCSAIEYAVSANIRDVLRESLLLLTFFSIAMYLNWKLMVGAMIMGPIIGGLTTLFSKAIRGFADQSFEGNKILNDTAQETLSNHTIVKAYRAEDREKKRFAAVAGMIAKANLRVGRISAISPLSVDTIGAIVLVTLLYFGLREIDMNQMDAAEFFTFLYFLMRSYDPIRKISRQHNELSKAFAAAKDVWDVLDTNYELPEKENAVELSPLKDKIELKRLTFNYDNDPEKTILKDLSLDVPVGQMIALVGESGGGKSSLIKLIQRLYDPTAGAILWDGTDLRDAKIGSLKKQIALVTQETVLFNESVKYNISYGNPDCTDEEIIEAAKIAFADEFIQELPQKYNTIVGERGTFLSGGQRQRIAIARAVLVNAPVLILDEATSALDAESERLVQKALTNLMLNKTSIVIAHRLSTIRRANKIIVMEAGKVIEAGTHEELISSNGKYKHLYELQFAGEEQNKDLS